MGGDRAAFPEEQARSATGRPETSVKARIFVIWPPRERPFQTVERRYRDRWRIEAAFCRLKGIRRVATRYDEFVVTFLSAVCLAAVIAFRV